MSSALIEIHLTPLQLSHAIVALQKHGQSLLKDVEEEPEGGEHEDYLIAHSIIKLLVESKVTHEQNN